MNPTYRNPGPETHLLTAWGLVLLLAAGFVSAAPETALPSLEQRVDTYLEPYLEIEHLSGTVLVAREGDVVYEKSFGLASHELGVSNTPGTLYCIGSINKPLTIVILARMIEAKQLALTDKLSKFLPDFPRAGDITIDNLLNHSAGIPHRVTETIDETRPQTAASMVELAAGKALVFEPGSDNVYSSAGFSVLARVLELASGKPYAELLTEHVLKPAGMKNTFDVGSRVVLANRAASYAFDTDGLLNAQPQDVSYLVGAGSVYSTPRDLLAFQRALLVGTYGKLAQEWLVRENGNLGSNGLAAGFRAFADYDAETGISVIVASNLVSGALDRVRRALPEIAAGEKVETPSPIDAKAADVDPKLLESYVGDYELRPGRNLELRIIDGRVRMGDWLLIPTSDTTLFSPQDYAVITVVSDESGEIERLDWTTGGNTYPMPKVSSGASPAADHRAVAIDEFITPFVGLAMFDGTILVDIGGEVTYKRSFGFAHREYEVRHNPDTKFRIASVSKTFTDAAFAVLIQRGVLTLDTPVAKFLPSFPSAESITISQLLDHTSGIAHTNDQPWGDGSTSLSLDEIVRRLAALPLDFAPGTDSSYSNGGYAVAAKILELAGKGTYAEVMGSTVFEPLGLGGTGHIADSRSPIPGLATGYEPGGRPGERRQARFYAVETKTGGGSLYSTADDLLRFARSVFREQFLDESLVRTVLGADDGQFVSQGRSPGCVAKLLYDSVRDVIVVSLANNYAVPADWTTTIADLATGVATASSWPEIRQASGPVAADDLRLGLYRSSRGNGQLSIERNSHGEMVLVEPAENRAPTALIPLDDGSFLQPLYYQRCQQQEADRSVTCRILSGNPRYTAEWTPIPDAPN